jgi:hypothetical protein
MDSLVQSCEHSSEYPQNLVCRDVLSHNLRMYFKKLSSESTRMFQNCDGEVDFLDLKVESDGMYRLLVGTATSAGKTANGPELRQNFNQNV